MEAFFVYLFLVLLVVSVMLGSYFLGPQVKNSLKMTPYEAGLPSVSHFNLPMAPSFYIFAMLFVVFDLETLFLVCFSLVAKQLGVFGLIQAGVFILSLLVALVYLFKVGAFHLRGKKP